VPILISLFRTDLNVVGGKYALKPTKLFLNASAEASITLRCCVEIVLSDHLYLEYPKVERNQVLVIQAWPAIALKLDMNQQKAIRKLPERMLTMKLLKMGKSGISKF
jgi:hypothetical protein